MHQSGSARKSPLAQRPVLPHIAHMPFAPHVFQHTPALRGRITPPDRSEMRFGLDRFDALDVEAAAEGWPPGWRMDHGAREANRQATLAGRWERDLWVFAYGSLIWDPAVYVEEYRYAALPGWHRRFCMHLDGGRATHDCPGLMAALDAGGHCDGVAIRIKAARLDTETRFMWHREMFAGSYTPEFHEVSTPQGPVEALVFVMDQANARYCPDLPIEEAARRIARAEGRLGSNFQYLDNLVRHLAQLGLRDAHIEALHRLAQGYRVDPASEKTSLG